MEAEQQQREDGSSRGRGHRGTVQGKALLGVAQGKALLGVAQKHSCWQGFLGIEKDNFCKESHFTEHQEPSTAWPQPMNAGIDLEYICILRCECQCATLL
eukprot:1158490-Pelagomonas_calceolata.AAC.4